MTESSKRSATIKDVAKRAGVSIGTVSRVVNNSPNVGESYRARVEEAIRQLDYRPNVLAQRFVSASSKIVSLVLANRAFFHPIHPRILQGASDYCEEHGYFVLFSRFQYSLDQHPDDLQLPQVLHSHGAADSVILAGLNYGNLLESLERARAPYVTFGNSLASGVKVEPYDVVRVDDVAAAAEAVRHLVDSGHERILYIGDTSLPWYENRYRGYLRAMRDAGLEPLAQTSGLSQDLFGNGQLSTAKILDQGRSFTAIFAGIDAIGYGAMATLRERGLSVPGDVSVVGFGDQYGEARTPPLTTVRIDTEEAGRRLAQMALQKIENPNERIPEVVLDSKLIVRPASMRPRPRAA